MCRGVLLDSPGKEEQQQELTLGGSFDGKIQRVRGPFITAMRRTSSIDGGGGTGTAPTMARNHQPMMVTIYERLLERNARETAPFVAVHESNARLLNQVDALQARLEGAEREASGLRQELLEGGGGSGGGGAGASALGSSPSLGGGPSKASAAAARAAIKNEARLRDKLEALQEELNGKLRGESDHRAAMLRATQELSEMKDLNAALERTVSNLKEENGRSERAIAHLNNEVGDAKSRTDLAEKQYEGLKRTIRKLQDENDKLAKENRKLEERLLGDKGKTVEEMNALTDLVNALKMEVDMLRSYKIQEDRRRSGWFGGGGGLPSPSPSASKKSGAGAAAAEDEDGKDPAASRGRKWGSFGVVLPSSPKVSVAAHAGEGTCLRYDDSGADLVATAGSDSCVKVFETGTGACRATLRGTPGHAVIGCDLSGGLVAGGGSDKTCRVWNLRTERMIHHLVGHQHKVTCVRLYGSGRSVITGSADRSLKVWDVGQKTYRQTVTLRHGSSCNCVDVAADSVTAASGHLDGGLRFWDLRSGERTADISAIHEGAITSVRFQSGSGGISGGTQVLTNSMDSSLKLVDVRTGTAIHTFRHPEFATSYGWSSACFSPGGGAYVAAGSNSTGEVLVWSTADGTLRAKLSGHTGGVCGVDWGRGGSNGQQVASIDRKGLLILWA